MLILVVAAFLAVGASRASGPSTPAERAEELEKRVACPTCSGESVYESRATASENIKDRIRLLVDEGQLADDQIIGQLEVALRARVLLVPKASGFDALVWVLPVAALVCAAGRTRRHVPALEARGGDRRRSDRRRPRAGRHGAAERLGGAAGRARSVSDVTRGP